RGQAVTRQADVYSTAVVLWEALTGRRLFAGDNEGRVVEQVLFADVEPPSRLVPSLPAGIDTVVLRGLARDREQRFRSARELATALQNSAGVASPAEVGEWVERLADEALWERQRLLANIDRSRVEFTDSAVVSERRRPHAVSLFDPNLVA